MCVSKENVCHGATFSNTMQQVRSRVWGKITIDSEAYQDWQSGRLARDCCSLGARLLQFTWCCGRRRQWRSEFISEPAVREAFALLKASMALTKALHC